MTSISLPLTDLARSEPVVVAVALGQTAALLVLLGARLVVVRRPAVLARRSAPASRAVDTSVPSSRSA